jgi:hypothetical protein
MISEKIQWVIPKGHKIKTPQSFVEGVKDILDAHFIIN